MKRQLIVLLALHSAFASALDAPNVVQISPRVVTSGQPQAASVASLRKEGFTGVLYIPPPKPSDAWPREALLLREQGIDYVQVRIHWQEPTDADYDAFAAGMKRLPDGKVLVHCQMNFQASTMTFLYRVIALGEPAEKAYESVAAVWSPNAVWKRYIVAQLARAGIAFDPY